MTNWVRVTRLPLLFAFLAGMLGAGCGEQRPTRHAQGEPPQVLRLPADSGAAARAPLASEPAPSQHMIDELQLEDLRLRGFRGSATTLAEDLIRHPELIPFPGVLGGTMGFYDSTQVHVLNDRWVYAYFEDGHIGGFGVFQYSVGDSGQIKWKCLNAFPDD